MTQGTIIRVAGPVVDVQFTEGKLPALQEALTVTAASCFLPARVLARG